MPLYKRKGSPFYWYSFAIDGVRFRGSTGEAGKREARRVEAQKQHDAERNKIPRDNWTLEHCLAQYWQDKAKFKTSSQVTLHKLGKLRQIIGSKTSIMSITNATMLDYRAKRRGEGLEPHSVNRDFAYLKAALRHAQQMHGQQIPALAWRELKMKEPPGRDRFLSREEYDRLLSVCDDDVQLIVKFAVGTGLRKNNILKLDWREVNLSSGRITVTVKGDKTHSIRMPKDIRAALSTLPHRQGQVFNTGNFRRKWDRAVNAAKLHNFRFHDLRHTFASWARMAGADIADICDALGHSSVAVTMRYAHIEPANHITAFDRISAQVWAQPESQNESEAQKA